MSKCSPQFIQFCKTYLSVNEVTKDIVDHADPTIIKMIMRVLSTHAKCLVPADVSTCRQLIWRYIDLGVVPAADSTPVAPTRTPAVTQHPPQATATERKIPKQPPSNQQIVGVVLKGSKFEERFLTALETSWVVHAVEMPRISQIPVRLPELLLKHPTTRLVADVFCTNGEPLNTSIAISAGKQRLNISFPSKRARAPETPCPYSQPVTIAVDKTAIKSYDPSWAVSIDSVEERVVFVLRIVRAVAIETLVNNVVVRTKFETRVPATETTVFCTLQKYSTRCPLGFCRIEYPARGRRCAHDSFFDLKTYLLYGTAKDIFVCPLCERWLPPCELEMCDPFYRALREYKTADYFVLENGKFVPADPCQKTVLYPPAKRPCVISIE
ncbi:MAG: hypothetical protein AB7P49_00125 [Bdellovibrionales bacterium]